MAFLEIVHLNGETEKQALSKQVPVTIGSHASADVTIDEDDVEILHCRISWNKNHFEAVAIGNSAIDVNGSAATNAKLKDADVLRFGSVDVSFFLDKDDDVSGDDDSLSLKPLTEEIQLQEKEEKGRKSSRREPVNIENLSDSLSAGLAALAAESQSESLSEIPAQKEKKSKRKKSKSKPEKKSSKPVEVEESASQDDSAKESAPDDSKRQPAPDGDDIRARVRDARRSARHRRPGEEDPLRSPLVLGLAGGAVALALTGAIFYFIAFRQTTQQEFDQAKAVYDEGKFQNAITEFEQFLLIHPKDALAEKANEYLGLARVRQQIESATPDFPNGLDELRTFVRDNSGREEEFEALHPEIVNHAKTISLGAAQLAGRTFNEDLLDTSQEARTILTTYSPKDAPPTETLRQIQDAIRSSQAAILKNTEYKDHVERMQAALKSSPIDVLKIRRDLLVRYNNIFENDKTVVSLFNQALKAEQKKVIPDENANQDAVVEDRNIPANSLTIAFQGRTQVDEVSVGRAVVALAKDCCYGVDFVTGEPIWRRVIGLGTPFFPLQESSLPSVVVFDTNHNELVRLHQATGQLIWRQAVGAPVSTEPLLVDNTIYISTDDNALLAVDLESGQLVGKLKFSQPVSGPVPLRDDQHMLVAGSEEVLYTISKRPFECVQVSYLGQAPGSIDAPLVEMGPYVLMIENSTDSATMHLLQAETGTDPIKEVASEKIGGRVIDDPVIRGRDLFVPATGERVYAFNVSDDPGQPPLTAGPVFEGSGTDRGSLNLLTGPNGEVWMATEALQRLQLTTDSLQPDGGPIAPGNATQPLQSVSGFLLNGRSRYYTDAVTFTRTNRQNGTSDWQIVLGGEVLASTVRQEGSLNIALINEAGHAFRLSERQLSGEDFFTAASVRLPLHPDLTEPLLAAEISRNRIAVACGNPEPRLWIINAAGQIEGSPLINKPLQVAPCPLGDRVVLPMEGVLDFARFSGQSRVRGYELPAAEGQEWRCVIPAGDEQIVAVTNTGSVILLKIQPSPSAHLAEIARMELGADVLFPVSSNAQLIAVADGSRKLSVLDTTRLDPVATKQFAGPITSTPFLSGNHVLVVENYQTLHCLDSSSLNEVMQAPLGGSSITGSVQFDSHLVVAQTDGTILHIDLNAKTVSSRQNLQAILASPPFVIGGQIFVYSADGTLYRIQNSS